jgi:syntaxin-binding protein 1
MEKMMPRTLKTISMDRILKDMLQDTISQAQGTMVVLILDDFTSKVISSFLTMTEVLSQGIFSVDRLDTKRQKFPKYHALYYVSPSAHSCEEIVKDFQDESKPAYSRAHVYFSHKITNTTLEKLVTQNTCKRIKTCKEVNLSFLTRDRNLFDIGMSKALEIFTVKNNNEQTGKIVSNICERLFTVCAALKEYPYIQYQSSSKICSQLAQFLNAQLGDFYNSKLKNENRATLLILDRTFDITTPFLHDYNYETMVYDLFNVKDNQISLKDNKGVLQIYMLDEKDDLWMRYKNKHMCIVFEEIQKDFAQFMESDASKVQKAGDANSFEEMSDVLQGMKGYKTKANQFSLHLRLAEEITNVYKRLFRNIRNKI